MRCTDLAVHPKRTSSKKGGSATARQSGQKNHKQRMAASFGLVLRALGYPGSPPGQGSLGQGSEEVRKLVSWLEDTKVRRKKPYTNRTPPNPPKQKARVTLIVVVVLTHSLTDTAAQGGGSRGAEGPRERGVAPNLRGGELRERGGAPTLIRVHLSLPPRTQVSSVAWD